MSSSQPETPARKRPVFVVGAARSGTTLLQQMLDHHPAFAFPWESHFLPEFYRHLAGFGDLENRHNRKQLILAINEYSETIYRGGEEGDWIPGLVGAADKLAEQAPPTFAGVVDTIYTFFAQQHGKSRWGDKTPGYVDSLPLIGALFPDALFIHIIRDGRDVAASVMPLSFGPNSAYLAARKWEKCVRHGLSYAEKQPERVYTVKYEDLVDDPETNLRRMCAFLGEDFAPAMLDFHKDSLERVRLGQSMQTIHTNIAQPTNKKHMGRWKRDLSADEVRVFEAVAGRMLQRLGYELSQPDAKLLPLDSAKGRALDMLRMFRYKTKPNTLPERIAMNWTRRKFRWNRAR